MKHRTCPIEWRTRFNPFWHQCVQPDWHGTPHRSRFGFTFPQLTWRNR